MIYILLNLRAILAATGAGLLVSAAYGLSLRRSGAASLGFAAIAALAEFWLASILAGALILAPAKSSAWVMAVGSAVVIWVGFVVPALVVTEGMRGAKRSAIAADCALWLAVMVVQAMVLKAVGVHAPPA